jgi:hypothetical protein
LSPISSRSARAAASLVVGGATTVRSAPHPDVNGSTVVDASAASAARRLNKGRRGGQGGQGGRERFIATF